ncbi:MAG: sigma-70 family RNA polymerase sigma factor [Oscillospiraceae bacterium]|nr:sigma-70 family RNA polymerase sigma factor [Oscillospiraceae bacterium]
METYAKLIYHLCRQACGDDFAAEDLTQETFLAAYRHLDRFDGAHEKAWLTRIAANKCLDYLRSAAKRRQIPAEDGQFEALPAPDAESPESAFFERHWSEALRSACASLREPYRSLALSYYCEGTPLAQIAAERGEPLATVQTRAFRARSMLQTILKEEIRA